MADSTLSDIESGRIGRRLAGAALVVAGATAFSRIFGYVREVVAAGYFGAGAEKSAFDVAFLVPSTFQVLAAQAALSAALIPVFAGLLEQKRRREAWLVARTIFTLIVFGLGVLVVLAIIFAPSIMWLFAPGYRHDAGMMEMIVSMSRMLFPTVLLLAVTGLVISVLNSFEHFTLPALAPIAWNLLIVLAMVFFAADYGIYALAGGVLVGTVAQLLIMLPALRGRGGRLGFSLALKNPDVRRVGLLMLPVSLSLGLINLNGVVDIQFASFLGERGVAGMNYAFRLYQLPEAIFAITAGTVLFPTLSKLAARDELGSFRSTVSTGIRVIFFLLIPISACIVVLAEPLVRLAYQHGRFTAEDTALVSWALLFFAFGSAFSGAAALLTRAFFSLKRPWTPTLVALANLGANAVFNLLFIRLFDRLGLDPLGGIPLSTTLVSLLTFLALLFFMRRQLGRIDGATIIRSVLTVVLVSALAAAAAWLSWRSLDSLLGRELAGQVLSLAGAFAAALAVFLALALTLRMRELKLVRALKRR